MGGRVIGGTMRMLPLFEEIEVSGQEGFPKVSLVERTNRLEQSLRDALAQYLRAGEPLMTTGNVTDPLDETKGQSVPFGFCTDGSWVWPTYWEYFVREYGVDVPEEFINHAQVNNFQPVELSEEALDHAEEEFEREYFA